jgi:hypothetical protein
MITNLLKTYPAFLDLIGLTEHSNRPALYPVFKRDFIENPIRVTFLKKPVLPTPKEGEEPMETLYRHLTTVVTDKATRKREFESTRSIRLHWVLFHINQSAPGNIDIFSVEDAEGKRTYIYDAKEKYVVILEPLRDGSAYYLLTAYYLRGGDGKKIESKRKRKLAVVL